MIQRAADWRSAVLDSYCRKMSGLQARGEDTINGVDVRDKGSALRVATNTPHLVSLGTGRLSTAVTLHPIKQGRVTIGSDPTCDIYVVGTGVSPIHCRVENSHGVVTLYPVSSSTLLDGLLVDKPTRLSQGSMLTIGRSNYLRFNHPEEAKLMKSVLPRTHVSMAPVQFTPNEQCTGYQNHQEQTIQCYQTNVQKAYKEHTLSQLDQELDMTLKDLSRRKPPVAPRKPYRELELDQDSNSDQETKPKVSSIMAKVSKFEYYAKQQKNMGRSQFYTSNENEISPKVFSSNSLTVNTPAKDVLGGKNVPNYIHKMKDQKVVLSENNSIDPKNCSYANVAIRRTNKIDDIVRNFDDNNRLPKKVNNDQKDHIYGKINTNKNNFDKNKDFEGTHKEYDLNEINVNKLGLPSPAYDRNPQYSPVYANCHYDRSLDAESKRVKAYQERVKEEEQKEAETARLEEILNMCAEYERQIASGVPITPPEKRAHNKIITNGSLPRSVALNNPNFVQTSDGYYKFETSHNRNNSMSQSLPVQRNLSHYENFNISDQEQYTPEVTIKNQSNYENVGRMDEIGIPVFDLSPKHELSSPIMIRKLQNGEKNLSTSPIGSPYENVYYNRNNVMNLKPKSPNTNSPRSRIKTTFAHKNLPSPQYFVFPTPPPVEKEPDFNQAVVNEGSIQNGRKENYQNLASPKEFPQSKDVTDSNRQNYKDNVQHSNNRTQFIYNTPISPKDVTQNNFKNYEHEQPNSPKEKISSNNSRHIEKGGIEKQLSLEEEIPMIDDADITNDIECRYATAVTEKTVNEKRNNLKDDVTETKTLIEILPEKLTKNKSFDDVKKELMADIPELEEFENDLKESKREQIIKNITDDIKKMDIEADSLDSILDDNVVELKSKYNNLKEERKQLMTEIHDLKNKMSEIRSQEDDILRELEMEKALIKGEYDSEIAILNIEQKKKVNLLEKSRRIEVEWKKLKERQEQRQNDMRDRVEIATLKVERIEKDMKENAATMEELQNAQDILDNETKIIEDLEFQHLEEESELLANREDLQNEIILLTKKIEAQKSRILTLKSEANDNLTSALDETKILQAEYVRLLNQVEDLTGKVQVIEKELKPIVNKLNDIERTQSPDSAFYTDQTRAKSGEFGYSPQSSDSDDLDLTKTSSFEDHRNEVKDKFNAIDRMSQSMIVDIERRVITDIVDDRSNESPSKTSTSSKEKKGFWERNFDSLKRKKKPKPPEKTTDIMSQSLNENMFYNSENIETDNSFDKFNSLRHSKKKEKPPGPVKSNSSSKIPTFAALGKIIKKDSFGKKTKPDPNETESKNRYIKNCKVNTDNKYKSKSLSPDKTIGETINEETEMKDEPNTKTGKPVTQNGKTDKVITLDNMKKPVAGKILHRKSCGDEPSIKPISEFQKISDSGKIPSQDDIDRISKVTMDAPILSSDTDMNSLGKRTLDSLMEIERKRIEMLEEQGCQLIENEREKISELKRRAQDETKKLWDQKSREQSKSIDSDNCQSLPTEIGKNDNFDIFDSKKEVRKNSLDSKPEYSGYRNEKRDHGGDKREEFIRRNPFDSCQYDSRFDRSAEDSSVVDDSFNMTSSTIFEESSGLMSSSIEELQVRNSRTESTEDEKLSDSSRPLSHASDFSRDNILSLSSAPRRSRRGVAPYGEQRPLTRYLPVDRDDFDLRTHVESAGHQIELCPYVTVNATSCRGYLHKLGAKFHTWSKRWFVFDRVSKAFVYYWDKSEKKPRGGAYFQVIEEVYLDHGNTSKSPSPQTTFIVKTRQRRYYLMAPSGEAARVWIDVIFTGAQGYTEYLE